MSRIVLFLVFCIAVYPVLADEPPDPTILPVTSDPCLNPAANCTPTPGPTAFIEQPTSDGATVYDDVGGQTVAFRFQVTAGEFMIALSLLFQVTLLIIAFVLYQKWSAHG